MTGAKVEDHGHYRIVAAGGERLENRLITGREVSLPSSAAHTRF